MERLIRISLLAFVCSLFPQLGRADLLVHSIAGNVYSEFDAVSDLDASTQLTILINSNVAANNSFTSASANWNWNQDTLTAASLITAEKTISARPGGEHRGTSGLVFEFELTREADFNLGGSWGLDNPSGTDDLIRFELVGPGGVIVASDASTGATGVNSDTFAAAGQLSTGTYTFTIESELVESINNQGVSRAGWNLDFFTLTTIAVPEPMGGLAAMATLMLFFQRRRRFAS